ncbi:MAG: polysaccharide biosynthesis tyrosine autokinase [Planctomycetes bacterium]|nr:polysaccharide biosynthesis tyrosine autokinase [Planctomycetota bacterium]
MDFKDYLAIIRRRWYLFFPVIIATMAAHVLWVEYGQAERYGATSKVFVTPSYAPPPAEVGGLSVRVEYIRSLKAFQQTIQDTPVIERAVRLLLGEVPFESPEFRRPEAEDRIGQFVAFFQAQYGPERRKELLEELQGSISVVGEDEIVAVTASAVSQEKALAFSWAVVEGACVYHKEKATEGTRVLAGEIDVRCDDATDDLRKAEEAWAKVCRDQGYDPLRADVALTEDLQRLLTEKDVLESQIKDTDGKIREILRARPFEDAASANWQADLTFLDENPRYKNYRDMLIEAQLELDAKRVLLTPLHPEIQELEARIRRIETKVQSLVEEELPRFRENRRDEEVQTLVAQARDYARKLEIQKDRIRSLQDQKRQIAGMLPNVLPVKRRYDVALQRFNRLVDLSNDAGFLSQAQLGIVRVYDPEDAPRLLGKSGGSVPAIVLAGILAMLFAFGVVTMLEYIDTRVKSEHDIRQSLDLPLLAVIPKERTRDLFAIGSIRNADLSERFNTAATLLRTSARELSMKSFLIASAAAQEGKTTVAVNLAAALARKGSKVVLVDGDLRGPQIHTILGLRNNRGLSTLLEGRVDPETILQGSLSGDSIVVEDCIQQTTVENLFALPAGPVSEDPVLLIESDRMPRVIRKLTEFADFVIFDSPPVNKVGDALSIASIVDGSVLVIGSGQCDQRDVAWAKHLLANVQANILGVILNKDAERRPSDTYGAVREYRRSREKAMA